MPRISRLLAVVTMLCLLAIGCTSSTHAPKLVGAYSSGTATSKASLFLLKDGHAMAGNGMGTWEVQHLDGKEYVVLTLIAPLRQLAPVQEFVVLCELDRPQKMLRYVADGPDVETARQMIPEHFKKAWGGLDCFRFQSADIPDKVLELFRDFEQKVDEAKRQYEALQLWKKREQELEAATQPILEQIRQNPALVLELPLEPLPPDAPRVRGDIFREQERLKDTPEKRAICAAFEDKTLVFPEEVLLEFLEKYDWETAVNVSCRIFARDELSTESRVRLHPRILEFGKKFPHMLWRFYQHPKTPIELLKEATQVKPIMDSGNLGQRIRQRIENAEDASAPTKEE